MTCDKAMSQKCPREIVMRKKITLSIRQKLMDEKNPYKFARLKLKKLKDNAKKGVRDKVLKAKSNMKYHRCYSLHIEP